MAFEELNLSPVRPIPPLAGYVGGKRQLSRRLCERIATTPHGLYCEPFVGMGGVFFRRASRPKVEAINDGNGDIATLFRILQRHYEPFLDLLKWRLTSREEFERLRALEPGSLTDLERAARFLYLQRLSFGGKVASRTFGIDTTGPARFDIERLRPVLAATHERLSSVWIEHLGYGSFIDRWDRPQTLFFVDPPYVGTEAYYGRELFAPADHARLASALRKIKGRFLLTINDCPLARDLYSWADIEEAELSYSAGGAQNTKAACELIISSPSERC